MLVGVAVVAGVTLVTCLGCLVLAMIGRNQSTPRSSTVVGVIDTITPKKTETSAPVITDTPSATSTRTNTPPPSNTPLPTAKPSSTPKPTATLGTVAIKATYKVIDVRELQKSPDKYIGQKILLNGEIFKIQEENGLTGMQIWVSYPGASILDRIAVVVRYQGALPGVYTKQTVKVYGVGAGTFEGTNAYGGTISQPLVNAQYVDK